MMSEDAADLLRDAARRVLKGTESARDRTFVGLASSAALVEIERRCLEGVETDQRHVADLFLLAAAGTRLVIGRSFTLRPTPRDFPPSKNWPTYPPS